MLCMQDPQALQEHLDLPALLEVSSQSSTRVQILHAALKFAYVSDFCTWARTRVHILHAALKLAYVSDFCTWATGKT